MTRFWREHGWIIVPAIIILVVLAGTTWVKAYLHVNNSQIVHQYYSHSIDTSSFEIHVIYPKQVLYDTPQPVQMELWAVCKTSIPPCPEKIYLSSKNHLLDFAISKQDVIWETVLEVTLPKNHSAVIIQMRNKTPNIPTNLDTTLFLRVPGGSTRLFLPSLRFEGQDAAQSRAWLNEWLGTGSLIISLITAIFAGIQKLNEEKKRQRNQEIELFLGRIGIGTQGNIQQVFLDTLEQLKDWQIWEESLKAQFRKKHKELVGGNFISSLPENINYLQDILRDWRKVCQMAQVKYPDLLNLLWNATKADVSTEQLNGLANLLKNHPDSINIAKVIAQKIDPQIKKDALKLIDKDLISFLQVLGEEFGFMEEKEYPCRAAFWNLSDPSKSILAPSIFSGAGLSIHPFADAANPFVHYDEQQLFAERFTPGFRFDYQSISHQVWLLPTEWDLRVALHEYMSTWPKDKKRIIYIVLFTPELGDEYGWEKPRELLLHALAEQWLGTISQSLSSFYALKTTRREQLCRLLAWHFSSSIALLAKLSSQLENIDDNQRERFIKLVAEATQQYKSFPVSAEEIKTFIDVRPRNCQSTLFVCSSVSLNSDLKYSISEKQIKSLQQFEPWLSLHSAFLVCFQVGKVDDKQVIKIADTDWEQWCNLRLQICSNGIIDGLDLLFALHDGEPAEKILVHKANGSPGMLVSLGDKLFRNHLRNFPNEPEFNIQEMKEL